MSPRVAKSQRRELPQTAIRQGELGLFPLNQLSVSYYVAGCGSVILGHRDSDLTLAIKEQSHLKVIQMGRKKADEVDLKGKFFNGLSDALYRGKLPQVILATPQPDELNTFLSEFLEYISSLIALGYFLPNPESSGSPCDTLVPCYVITGDGVFFSYFLTKLLENLRMMDQMDEVIMKRLVGKFTRGFIEPVEGIGLLDQNQTTVPNIQLLAVPTEIKIAGGDLGSQQTVESVLKLYGFQPEFENNSPNPVERLEFQRALWRSSNVILPYLEREKVLSSKELQETQRRVHQTIVSIGRQRKAFGDQDALDKPTVGKKSPDFQLVSGDPAIFAGLKQYADMLGLESESKMLDSLHQAVLQHVQP